MEVGEAHGGLDDVGVEIGDACRAEKWKVVPDGTLLTASTTRFGLADEGIAQFVGPVVNVTPPPVGDDVRVSPSISLRIVVDDLGSADFARIQSHFDTGGVADGTGGLALQPGGSKESGGGKSGE